jgi:hypothetical protein
VASMSRVCLLRSCRIKSLIQSGYAASVRRLECVKRTLPRPWFSTRGREMGSGAEGIDFGFRSYEKR